MFWQNYNDSISRNNALKIIEYLISNHKDLVWFSTDYFEKQKESEEKFNDSKFQTFRWATKLYKKFAARLRKTNNRLDGYNTDSFSTLLSTVKKDKIMITVYKNEDDINFRIEEWRKEDSRKTILDLILKKIKEEDNYYGSGFSTTATLEYSSGYNRYIHPNYEDLVELITLWFCIKGIKIVKNEEEIKIQLLPPDFN